MLISSKVSNSILKMAEQKGIKLESLFTAFPMEFLQDPSCWMDAHKMEDFLSQTHQLCEKGDLEEDLVEGLMTVSGHSCYQLSSWGVLDKVLQMMDSVDEIYNQPDRFLSYFISPPPPVGGLENFSGKDKFGNLQNETKFQIPIAYEEYPFFSAYLKSALEGLPRFFSEDLASVEWLGSTVSIKRLLPEQENLFSEEEAVDRSVSPKFLRQLVETLENNQKELEARNRELLIKNQDLENKSSSMLNNAQVKNISDDLTRLQDYMIRSQQLVTLLVKQDRMDAQVKKAMHRVDWDYIQTEIPKIIDQSKKNLSQLADSSIKVNQNGEKTCQQLPEYTQEKLSIVAGTQL